MNEGKSLKNNILFIMADQLRWDGLGKTGGWIKTPNLDRIADEGMLFNNCLTNSPVCVPARAALATGLYPHNSNLWGNILDHSMPANSKTWMQAIRDAGYRTSLFGKSHLHRHEGDLRDREYLMHDLGFDDINEIAGPRASMKVRTHMTDEWEKLGLWDAYKQDFKMRFSTQPYVAKPSPLPLEHYADVYVGKKAKEYLRNYSNNAPWFCMVSFGGPHEPWDAPAPYAGLYDPKAMPKAIPRPSIDLNRPLGHLDRLFHNKNHAPGLSEQSIAEMRANYAGNMTLIDEQIGEIIQVLKDKHMYDHTIIVFTSDHGEMNGDYGLIYKDNFLNSAVKVPLIISTPETRSDDATGQIYDEMVELFDCGPTLCEIAGAPLEYQQFAKSLVPALKDPKRVHRREAIVELRGEVMIQNREWKLALNNKAEPYLLYNTNEDPQEQHNLVGNPKFKDITNQLRMDILKRFITCQTYIRGHL